MQTATEPFFRLPIRITPQWESVQTLNATTKDLVLKVVQGKLPIGLLPFEIITEPERLLITSELAQLNIRQYENTDETEKVLVHGNPFVDSDTVSNYLSAPIDPLFEELTTPLLERLIHAFSAYGFNIMPLIDPFSQREYRAKVIRQINVPAGCYKNDGNTCSVLHCDDIVRDGSRKPDFLMPETIDGKEYHQFSVCVQLEDGGYPPDNLYVYERRYSAELEKYFYGPGLWRYPAERLGTCRCHYYTPQLRQAYFFSTLNFHDVRGGHPLAKRINFSVFFIYVTGTNNLYYYN